MQYIVLANHATYMASHYIYYVITLCNQLPMYASTFTISISLITDAMGFPVSGSAVRDNAVPLPNHNSE